MIRKPVPSDPLPTVYSHIVTFETSLGSFKAGLFGKEMPITVGNFVDLIQTNFYNNLSFHRVSKNFINQVGCPFSKEPESIRVGTGGPQPNSTFISLNGETITRKGGNIPDEFLPNARFSNHPMTLSMANTGAPNSSGSQFFINIVHNYLLDFFDPCTPSRHPVFGIVIEGQDVVTAINNSPTNCVDNKPLTPIFLIKTTVVTC